MCVQQKKETSTNSLRNVHKSSRKIEQTTTTVTAVTKRHESFISDDESEGITSHSAKKGNIANEQIHLNYRQLKVAERNAATAAKQSNSSKRMADAAEVQAEAAKKMAVAAERTAAAIAEIVKATIGIKNI